MPDRFPQEVVLSDGHRLLIRRFSAGRDEAALVEFLNKLPSDVRRFAWDGLDDPGQVEEWSRHVDFSDMLPILAFDGTRVVAKATLHRQGPGPLRLVGRVHWLIDPEYRGRSLGTILIRDLIQIARSNGRRHMTCMLIEDLEKDAVQTLTSLGFISHRIPNYGTDPDGNQHDMVKMVLPL